MQQLTIVHYLPILTTVLSAIFAFVVFRRYRARGGAHLLWWSFGILVYGMGTFAEGWMTRFGWNPGIFKFWYIVGALMGGAPLAQGTVWLLLRERTARALSWIVAAVIAVAAVSAAASPINYAVVDAHVPSGTAFAWQWVRAFSPFINLYAVVFLIGGAVYSAWRFGRVARAEGSGSAIARDRFYGNVFIAVGAILPGIGGVATRMGHTEILYIGELAGIVLIWLGYWFNIRRRPATRTVAVPVAAVAAMLAVSFLAPVAQAQEAAAPLVVTTIAPDGAVLARVPVTLSLGEAELQTVISDDSGQATFAGLAPGRYRLTIAIASFQSWEREIVLEAAVAAVATARLQLAPLTERITVAATHTERSALEVPGEVSVVGRRELDQMQARSLEDAFRYLPGVEMTDSPRRLGQTVNIRGFDERRVLTIKDGARVSQYNSAHKGTGFFDIEDVQTVEVVKGSSSALYGSGAIGGVVSVTTRDPGELLNPGHAIGGSLRTSYSSAYGDAMVTPRLYGQSRSGMGWMLSYTGRRNDGNVKLAGDASELTRAEEDVDNYVARVTTPLGDRSALRLSFDQYRQRGAGTTNLAIVVPGPSTAVDRQTRQTTLNARFNMSGDHWFDDAVTVTAYYTGMAIEERRVSDQRFDDIGYRTWGAQARNTARIGAEQTLTYGVEYVNERQRATRNDGANGFFPDGRRQEIGVYVQDEVQLAGGRLLVIPGLRYDNLHSSADDERIASQSFTRLSPKVGATYELVDGLVAAVSYGHGFRAPFFQELFPTGVHFAFPLPPHFFLALFEPNPGLRPERSRSWDAGMRFSTGRLRARAAYWESRVEDFIDLLPVQTLPPTGGLILQRWQSLNRQDAVLRGFEASVDWQPHADWVLHGGYSLARGEDRATGEALLQMPSDTLFMGVDWTRTDAGTRVAWVTRAYGDHTDVPTGVTPTEGYVLHDLHASWSPRFLRDVSLYASVNNLTNTRYEDPRFGTPGIARDVRLGFGLSF